MSRLALWRFKHAPGCILFCSSGTLCMELCCSQRPPKRMIFYSLAPVLVSAPTCLQWHVHPWMRICSTQFSKSQTFFSFTSTHLYHLAELFLKTIWHMYMKHYCMIICQFLVIAQWCPNRPTIGSDVHLSIHTSTKSFFSNFDLIWCVGRSRSDMRTSMTSTRSKVKVKVTGLLKFRKLHFSTSMSSAISAWSSKLMIDYDSMGPSLQLVGARFSNFL